MRQNGQREGDLSIFARIDHADSLAVRRPQGSGVFASLDSLAAKQDFLCATLHALRADSKDLRAKSQALRVASHALRAESADIRGESVAIRARSRELRGAAIQDIATDGHEFAKASARVSAQRRLDEIATTSGKPPDATPGSAAATELAPADVIDAIAGALRELTANLIRIVSGSGRSSEIIGQLLAVALALEHYSDVATGLPDESAVAGYLDWHRGPLAAAALDDPLSRRLLAEDTMIRAALQVAASRLMSQPALESLALDELYQGIQSVLSLLAR